MRYVAGRITSDEISKFICKNMYEISKSSAQMLMCYETLDDFLSFDGRGSRSGAWQYDKFMATKKQPNLVRVVGPREAEMIEAERK